MRRIAVLVASSGAVVLGLSFRVTPGAQGATSPSLDTVLVLEGGRYLDTRTGRLRPNGAILVRDGRIAEVLPPGAARKSPPGARTLDLRGRTALPGLIDAHVHLTLSDDPATSALTTLRAGFTTVVDLGSASGAGLRLRDQIARGVIPGPAVIAAGSWIGAKGGVCEFGGATVEGAEEARSRALADLEAGADLLKVCVTGWPAAAVAAPDSVELGPGPLDAVLEVARAARRPAYAHAIGRAGALLAAEHGVRALAHTPIVDSATAMRLKATGVVVITTLATLTARREADEIRRSFQLLRSAGVPIVLGTDAGVLPHGRNADEILALVEAGLTPAEAIRAATLQAAALLGRKDLGEIVAGAAADLVVVAGDPLQDPGLLARPALVLKAGRELSP
jgi:imidazolonepropionase-like amidohydrolase